ncbi:biotin-dependent carboxyltransferase family protein [Geojedonia litorea]|uniref:Biotin-dependent carboxyltransferase family protein n=1 Tax=Geojedonia litorea TaxID=1268269 RepID=A0ABV9N177_9FLAO
MVRVIKPGFYSTIQDLGRLGYQDYGVPISGAMDQYSSRFANAVLNNKPEAALLEITMTGPILEFQIETYICISGADMAPKLNASPIKMNKVVHISPNDLLSFGGLTTGFRAYLGVFGGFQTGLCLDSRSMFNSITSTVKIEANQLLPILTPKVKFPNVNSSLKFKSEIFNSSCIEVFKGPEFDLLNSSQQERLFQPFRVSGSNNRMGYQLEELLENNLPSILTSPVMPGTVQLTPSGSLIILMRDGQTTGGYPRILQLKESAINFLAQTYKGSLLQFKLVD